MKRKALLMTVLSAFIGTFAYADDNLIKQAEAGDPVAQFKVAALYATGKIGNKSVQDREKMLEWLEKSASQGLLKAQETLCKKYIEINEPEKAYKWCKEAVKQNSPIAKSVLAYFYYNGEGVVPINRVKAYELARATENEPLSKGLISLYYTTGWFDIKQDLDRAEQLLMEIKDANSLLISVMLCNVYMRKMFEGKREYYFEKAKQITEEARNRYPTSTEIRCLQFMLNFIGANFNFVTMETVAENMEELEKLVEKETNKTSLITFYTVLSALSDSKKQPYEAAKSKIDYMLKSAELGCSETAVDAMNELIVGKNIAKDTDRARKIIDNSIKYQHPKLLATYNVMCSMARTAKPYRDMLGSAYVENYDLNKYIKIAADNGVGSMMYLYSKQKDISESEKLKYLTGAANVGWVQAATELAIKYRKSNPKLCSEFASMAESFSYDEYNKTVNVGAYSLYTNLISGYCDSLGIGREIFAENRFGKFFMSLRDGLDPKIALWVIMERLKELGSERKINYYSDYMWTRIALNSNIENSALRSKIEELASIYGSAISKENQEKANNTIKKLIPTDKRSVIKSIVELNLIAYGVTSVDEKEAVDFIKELCDEGAEYCLSEEFDKQIPLLLEEMKNNKNTQD